MDKSAVTAAYFGGFGVVLFAYPQMFFSGGLVPYWTDTVVSGSTQEWYTRLGGAAILSLAAGERELPGSIGPKVFLIMSGILIAGAAFGAYSTAETSGVWIAQLAVHTAMTAWNFM